MFLLIVGVPCAVALGFFVFIYSPYSVVSDWWSGEWSSHDDVCFMSVEVMECARQECPTPDSCSIEEHEIVEKKCHNECLAQ